jgi:hypothetical protein
MVRAFGRIREDTVCTVQGKLLGISWSAHVTGVVLSFWQGAYIIGKQELNRTNNDPDYLIGAW